MNRNFLKHNYREEATPDGGDGGGGAAPDANPAPVSAISGDQSSIPMHESMPEKFRVFDGEGDDAKFNLESSSQKLLDSYSSLEKRGGAPESPEEYSIDAEAMGEGFDAEAFMSDESTKGFLKRMHAKGMSNAQVQEVIDYGLKEWAPNMMQGNVDLTSDQATDHMKTEVWSDPAQYKENMGQANRAYSSLSPDLQNEVNERIGNDPVFIKVMAIFGKEMREDTPPLGDTVVSSVMEVEEMMKSDAYKDSKHKDHEAVSKQVRDYFKSKQKK